LLIKQYFNVVLLSVLGALLLTVATQAAVANDEREPVANTDAVVYQFKNEVDRARYYSLIAELRCPKCQNQSLSDSDAISAEVLREQVYLMIQDNRSDQEIVMFMVERFGEFVLYRPSFSSSNAILWGAPALFLLIALIALFLRISSRKSADASDGMPEQSASNIEQQIEVRLKRVTDNDNSNGDAQ